MFNLGGSLFSSNEDEFNPNYSLDELISECGYLAQLRSRSNSCSSPIDGEEEQKENINMPDIGLPSTLEDISSQIQSNTSKLCSLD